MPESLSFPTLVQTLVMLLIFPAGLFLVVNSLAYEWVDRKLLARFQNRIGPRWFQPGYDLLKLMSKEEIVPDGATKWLFHSLPLIALAGALTAALCVPLAGLAPANSFPGDLVVTLYLMSLLTICTGIAGLNTADRFALVGAARTLTQLFSYEAPFLLALLGPALVARSWQISVIAAQPVWMLFIQPVGFLIAIIGLMGKLELPPFDAPEAETEIVAGALTEYSGRGFAMFRLARHIELVVGLTLIAALYLGGLSNILDYLLKTLLLLIGVVVIQALFTRLRIDQTVGLWWRYGTLLALAQLLFLVLLRSV